MLAYLVVILCFFGVPAFFIGLAFWYLLAPAKPTLAELLALKHLAIPRDECACPDCMEPGREAFGGHYEVSISDDSC
jgi:hypothetical protein